MPTDEGSFFDWKEIACDSEAVAKAEAQRQQLAEDSEEVEWIYLRNKSRVWVARRTLRHPPEEPDSGWWWVVEAILDSGLGL